MTQTAAERDGSAAWTEVLELAAREESGRVLVERLLDLARSLAQSSGVALYLGADATLEKEIVVGSGEFPAAAPAGDPPSGFASVVLPGAVILFEGAASAPVVLERGLRVALAAAIRGLRLEKRLKKQRFEVNYRGVELEALYDVGLAIASTLNLEELSEEILLRAVSLLDARRGALYLENDGCYGLDRTFGGEARERIPDDDPQLRALLAGEAGELTDPGEAGQGEELIPGAGHLLVVPIEADGKSRGLLAVGDKESRHGVGPFVDSDRRSLGMLATQAAIALENAQLHRQALEKERLEREAQLAAEIQKRLLPAQVPVLPGLELIGWNRSARQVGGDYYDLLPLSNGELAAVVADVTGKGMPAALMVSTLYSALRLLLDREKLGPDLVARLNNHIFESSAPNKFITLLVAAVDPSSGEVGYLNAGHNPGMLVRAGGEVEELTTGGMPLGLFAKGTFEHRSLKMETDDLLCFYSDGITECASPEDEEFGEERLRDLLLEQASSPLAEIVAAVDRAVTEFAAGLPQGDDQTLVLVRKTD
jgi:sigma-B regulation protein RsbU (phosphoserine phosphatase)